MQRSRIALSKAMSHALRHAPARYGLALDDEGWVPVAALLAALRAHDLGWSGLRRDDIADVVAHGTKQRFAISGDRIRALYGHSRPQRVSRTPATPPPRLFHGTSPRAAAVILSEGLRPMTRQHVHLSTDVENAVRVGRRRSPAPVVLVVDAAGAAADGVVFYRGNAQVWLADAVPGRYLAALED